MAAAKIRVKRLSDDQRALAAIHYPTYCLHLKMLRRRFSTHADAVTGAATEGYIEAAFRYRPGRGLKFPQYACYLMKRRALTALKAEFLRADYVSLDRCVLLSVADLAYGEGVAPREGASDQSPVSHESDPSDSWATEFVGTVVDERSRRIVELIVFGEMNFKEASRTIGVSQSYAWNLYLQAIAELRGRLASYGINTYRDAA